MAWRLEFVEVVKVTPERAKQFRSLGTYEAQRPLRERHLRYLEAALERDKFHGGEIALASDSNGSTVMVNGYHCTELIIRTSEEVPMVVKRFRYETSEDLARLFATFDVHAMRTIADIVRAEAHSLGIEWPSRICGLVVSGAALLKGYTGNIHRGEKVEKTLPHFIKEGAFVNEIFNGHTPNRTTRHLARRAVVAAMIQTHQAATKNDGGIEDVYKFWIDLRDGEMLKKTTSQYWLEKWLRENSSRRSGDKIIPDKEFRYRILSGWNAFREGRIVKALPKYFPDAPLPKAK